MKPIWASVLAITLLMTAGAADRKYFSIKVVDSRVSVDAKMVPLGWLMESLDLVAGTKSAIPLELTNQPVSARFSELLLDAAVEKIFEGAGLDYVVLEGRRIIVTAVSINSNRPERISELTTRAESFNQSLDNPSVFQAQGSNSEGNNIRVAENPAVPAVIQTPFGPIVNPRAIRQQGASVQNPLKANPRLGTNGIYSGSSSGTLGSRQGSGSTVFGNTSPKILDLNKPKAPQPPPK